MQKTKLIKVKVDCPDSLKVAKVTALEQLGGMGYNGSDIEATHAMWQGNLFGPSDAVVYARVQIR